jgi:hypothetical protein
MSFSTIYGLSKSRETIPAHKRYPFVSNTQLSGKLSVVLTKPILVVPGKPLFLPPGILGNLILGFVIGKPYKCLKPSK